MIIRNDGVITVDVPYGVLLEVRWVPAPTNFGQVGPVWCIYDGTPPVPVFQGGTSAQRGIPAYTCPLQVESSGEVELIENPTPEQLGGQYKLKINDNATVQGTPPSNIRDGAVIQLGSNSVTIGGVTYTESNDPVLKEATVQVESILSSSAPEGLEDYVFFYSGNSENFQVIIYAKDGDAGGWLGWGSFTGLDFVFLAAPYCLSND